MVSVDLPVEIHIECGLLISIQGERTLDGFNKL